MGSKKPSSAELQAVEFEFFKTVATLVISAFSLVAALAWNTAIQKIFERYFDTEQAGITSWLIYAIIVTIMAVFVTIYVGKVAKRFQTAEHKD